MGRPQKQTVDYFPHFANSGKTIFILENKFGNNGYAFWFKLLELFATTEGHNFRVGNDAGWEFLLAKTKVDGVTASEILNTLANLDAIDRELWQEKVIWCQNFVDNLAEVYKKRRVSAPEKPLCCSFRPENSVNIEVDAVTVAETPQSKVKESKEDVVVEGAEKSIGTQAVNFAEQSWGRPLKEQECDLILKACDDFSSRGSHEPESLVIYAIEQCFPPEIKVKIRYFDSIIRAWLDNGVFTVEKAKLETQRGKEGGSREQNRGSSRKHEEAEPRKSKYHIPTFIDGVEQPL